MHARRTVLNAIRDALEASSPAHNVFEEDETASGSAIQFSVSAETLSDGTSKAMYHRALALKVTCRGLTPSERDDLSEVVERALLVTHPTSTFEVVFVDVALKRHGAEGGRRVFEATYDFMVTFFTPRSDPSALLS